MRLSEVLDGLGLAVPFYPGLARMLESETAAILLAQMLWWSKFTDDEGFFHKSKVQIEEDLGIGRKRQEAARAKLRALGILEEHRSGVPARLHFRINIDALEVLWLGGRDKLDGPDRPVLPAPFGPSHSTIGERSKETHVDKQLSSPSLIEPVTFDSIIAGQHDADGSDAEGRKALRRVEDAMLEALVARWAEVWGRAPARVKVTAPRRKALRAAFAEGRTPSDFAKAILGMRHDVWPDRPQHNDFGLVLRHLEKWLVLYDEHGQPSNSTGAKTKTVNGVHVPNDYNWTTGDDFMVEQGYRFDMAERKWKSD